MFHDSQLKAIVGSGYVVNPLPQDYIDKVVHDGEPVGVLAKRYDTEGKLELLVQWYIKPSHDNWCCHLRGLCSCFHLLSLRTSLVLNEEVLISSRRLM